jgi:hypothetical protein
MTHRGTWKRFEREVAKGMGTVRTPLSGMNSGHNTSSDTLHKKIYSEAKYRKHWGLWALFEKVKALAAKESKTPCIYLKERGRPGYLMVFHSDDWFQLMKEYHDSMPGVFNTHDVEAIVCPNG